MKDPGKGRPVSLFLIPEVMDEPILRPSPYMWKDKKVIRSNQHVFMKRKLCLANLKTFYNEMMDMVDKGRPVDVLYLYFEKVFDTVFLNIFIKKLMKNELDKQRHEVD